MRIVLSRQVFPPHTALIFRQTYTHKHCPLKNIHSRTHIYTPDLINPPCQHNPPPPSQSSTFVISATSITSQHHQPSQRLRGPSNRPEFKSHPHRASVHLAHLAHPSMPHASTQHTITQARSRTASQPRLTITISTIPFQHPNLSLTSHRRRQTHSNRPGGKRDITHEAHTATGPGQPRNICMYIERETMPRFAVQMNIVL